MHQVLGREGDRAQAASTGGVYGWTQRIGALMTTAAVAVGAVAALTAPAQAKDPVIIMVSAR